MAINQMHNAYSMEFDPETGKRLVPWVHPLRAFFNGVDSDKTPLFSRIEGKPDEWSFVALRQPQMERTRKRDRAITAVISVMGRLKPCLIETASFAVERSGAEHSCRVALVTFPAAPRYLCPLPLETKEDARVWHARGWHGALTPRQFAVRFGWHGVDAQQAGAAVRERVLHLLNYGKTLPVPASVVFPPRDEFEI